MLNPITKIPTPPRAAQVLRVIVAALLLATLAACGVANLAYNNAPTLVNYYVDDWFDLTDAQRDWLKPRVTKLMVWHRANELPQYRQLLASMSARVETNATSVSEIAGVYDQSREAVDRLVLQAMPDMVAFLQQIEPAQVSALEKKFVTENDKLARELRLDADDRRNKRFSRYVERYEAWMGTLTDAQTTSIKARIAPLPLSEEMRLADRKRWQRDFVALIAAKPEPAVLDRELRVLLLKPESRRDAAYQTTWKQQHNQVIALTAELLAAATPKQKQFIQKKISGYSADITSLLKS